MRTREKKNHFLPPLPHSKNQTLKPSFFKVLSEVVDLNVYRSHQSLVRTSQEAHTNSYLIALTSPLEGRLVTLDVDIRPEVLLKRLRRRLGLLNSSVNFLLRILVKLLNECDEEKKKRKHHRQKTQIEKKRKKKRRGREQTTYLEFLLGRETPFLDVALQTANRVLCASDTLDLVTGTVRSTGVGHPAYIKT